VNVSVLHDLIAVPYTHCIMQARAPIDPASNVTSSIPARAE
jgi:hypothetical protein